MQSMTDWKRQQMQAAGVSPEYAEAVLLQDMISDHERTLKALKQKYAACLEHLAGTDDEVYAVTDLKPRREVDAEYVRQNLPEVYAETVKVSDTDAGRILAAAYTRQQVNAYLKEQRPDLFAARARITVGDFEKAVGKKEAKRMEGTAIRTTMNPTGKTRLVLKHPRKYPELSGIDEEEEEEDE